MTGTGRARAVSLPAGTAWFTVEGNEEARQNALEWLDVVEVLAEAPLSPRALRAELSIAGSADSTATSSLTPAEAAEMDAAGARPAAARSRVAARGESATWQVSMLASSLDVAKVARNLAVDPTRVRQRLRDRSLYGLRVGRSWRLPLFQFVGGGQELPHLAEVLRALPADLHPRSVEGFLDSPQPELVAGGEAVSPRSWLIDGGPPAPVVALAGSLTVG